MNMRKLSLIKSVRQTSLIAIFAFLLGCMFTVNIMPIDKTCKVEDSDREYNIMKNSKLKSPELIILILSSPKNIDKRTIIRQTWLKLYRTDGDEKKFRFKHYFVVGSLGLKLGETLDLNKEQSSFSDILILPIHDRYNNLTEKVKSAFVWLNEQYDVGVLFKYVLKCDDDSFVNVRKFVEELIYIEHNYLNQNNHEVLNDYLSLNLQTNNKESSRNNISLYWGYFSGNARVKSRGKWKETEWIISDRYLPYALGGGYLLSRPMVQFIAKNSQELRSFNSEDVSIGLWLAPVNDLLRIHDIRFDTEWTSRGCKNMHLIMHSVTPSEMRTMFNSLVRRNKLCEKETEMRNYYLYNWNVPPSQCCQPPPEKVIVMNRR